MRRVIAITVAIFLLIVAGILMFSNVATPKESDGTKEKTKVGIILNGQMYDHSWGQAHVEGLQKVAESLKLEIIYKENVPENEECIAYIEDLIKEGCKIIICDSFNYGDYEYEISLENPTVYFFHTSGLMSGKNFTSYFGRIYQMRYLSGIVAGIQTETNEIGYVAAMNIPEVVRGINAFTLGVKSVNPNATVYVSWSGDWNADEPTKEATYRLLDAHDIDVLAMHTDSLQVLEIAEEKGIWSIGYNIDNSKLYPNTFLTAPIWHWENFFEPRIEECIQGKFYGAHYWNGSESEMIDLAPLSANVKEDAYAAVEKAKERLATGVWDVFYGPIIDQDGIERVGEKENLSDEELLNTFDWFVDGVVEE